MSTEQNERLDDLIGKLLDDALSPEEDAELARILDGNPAALKQAILQSEMERMLIASARPNVVPDEAFVKALQLALRLQGDDKENARFAKGVAAAIASNVSLRRARFSAKARAQSPASWAWIAAGTAAAALLLFALLASGRGVPTPRNSDRSVPNEIAVQPTETIERPRNDTPRESNSPPAPVPPPASENVAKAQPPETPSQQNAAPEHPDIPGQTERVAETPPHANKPLPDESPGRAIAGKFTQLNGILAQRLGKADGFSEGSELTEGEIAFIAAREGSPGDANASVAELTLRDGSRLLLRPQSEFKVATEKGRTVVMVTRGDLTAHVKPQPKETPLQLRTVQGPLVEVVGTVFRVHANPDAKLVTLQVHEGQVLFRSHGVERRVSANEMSEAPDGRAPNAAWQFRPHASVLTGVVTDKSTTKPIAGVKVTIHPLGTEKESAEWGSIKTDEAGKFQFNAVPEGWVVVSAQTDTGGEGSGLRGRITSKVLRLRGGETAKLEIELEAAALVAGKVIDSSGKLLDNVRVHFMTSEKEFPGLEPKIENVIWPETEFRSVVTTGPGSYIPIVEKSGQLAKLRAPKAVQVRNDRLNVSGIEVQLSPSAIVKGQVTVGGKALESGDPTNADPHLPRTLVTLKSVSGALKIAYAKPDGTFNFDTNLDSGDYEIAVERFGFTRATRVVRLKTGAPVDVSVPLTEVTH